MKLFDALRAKKGDPSGKALADRLVNEVRVRALAKLEHTKDLFPYFTDHTIKHGDGVVAILDWLMPDSLKEKLNAWELYFLIAAAYLHDIGMVEGCPGSPSGDEWKAFFNDFKARREEQGVLDESAILLSAKREFVRGHHHARSEKYIAKEWRELGLRATDTPAEGQIVGRLAFGHRKADISDPALFGPVPFGNNEFIRRDLLAAYLRLADELDTTAHRTPWAEYEVLTNYDENSAIEWAKHLSIAGVSNEQGVIVIGGQCHDHSVYLRLLRLERDIKSKLVELRRMIRRPYATGDGFHVDDPLPFHDVEMRIEHVGYLPINIRFELQDREVTQLIMGERLYGDKTACIRELLQNAVDTCREAREQRPRSWAPKIEVVEQNDGKVLCVSDNGMGMDEYIVRQYFSKVGISYYGSPDFQGSFKPISEFGIGILSCFMMADRVEVDSKREGSEPIHVDIRSLIQPFVPRRGTRNQPGTTVRLHLKAEAIRAYDVRQRITHFAKHVAFPIEFTSHDGQRHTVVDRGMMPVGQDWIDLAGDQDEHAAILRSYVESNPRLGLVHTVAETAGIQLGVTLLDGYYSHLASSRASWALRASIKDPISRVSQQGFFVGTFDDQFQRLASMTWCELNLRGDYVLPLTADRTRAEEGAEEVWRRVANLYSKAIEQLYDRLYQQKTPDRWWDFHLKYYPDVVRPVPKPLRTAAREQSVFCTLSQRGFQPRTVAQIEKWKGPLYWVEWHDHRQLERIRKLLSADACVVVIPGWTRPGKTWYWPPLRRSRVIDPWRLLPDLGVRFSKQRVNGRLRWFMDAGFSLGKWRISWPWVYPRHDDKTHRYSETVLDANHPLSQVLLKYCADKLPRSASLILSDLSKRAADFTSPRLERLQRELFQALKEEGIVRRSATLPPVMETVVGDHDCPYGRR